MDHKNILYGLAGGLSGFLLSAPLVVHEGWTQLFIFRQKQQIPIKTSTFFIASGLIFPILMLLGIVGTPLIAAYSAYICGKESSLKPLISTFTAPYLHIPPENQLEMKVSRGMLIGYSVALMLTSFTVLNAMTGGIFGALAVPGAIVLSTLGFNVHSVFSCLLGATLISYASGLIGGAIAGFSDFVRPKVSEQTGFSTPYAPLTDEEMEEDSSDPIHYGIFASAHPYLPGGGRLNIPMRSLPQSLDNDSDEEEMLVFDPQKPEQPYL